MSVEVRGNGFVTMSKKDGGDGGPYGAFPVLSGRACARAKAGDGPVQIARTNKLTKASAVKARAQTINQLKAVVVTTDPALPEELAGLGNAELFRTCARFTDARSRVEAGEEMVL
ncbi:hypothetical protein ACPCBC_00040 [Streptomyces incarnatus]